MVVVVVVVFAVYQCNVITIETNADIRENERADMNRCDTQCGQSIGSF